MPLGDYTDVRDGSVSVVIRSFQQDNLLVDAVSGKPKPGVLPGLVEPGGATWTKLVAAVPDAYKTVRTTEGVSLVYFPMSPSALARAKGEIQAGGLKNEFQVKVTNLLDKFYAKSGIVVSANPDGLRRTFEQQVNKRASEASPGETIHNYGYAVDLGFIGLSYVSRTGGTQTVDAHDGGVNKWPRIKEQIFAARSAVATRELNLFPTVGLGGADLYHLQNYADKPLDSVSSFMKLLEKVGPMKMKWRPEYMTWTDYVVSRSQITASRAVRRCRRRAALRARSRGFLPRSRPARVPPRPSSLRASRQSRVTVEPRAAQRPCHRSEHARRSRGRV